MGNLQKEDGGNSDEDPGGHEDGEGEVVEQRGAVQPRVLGSLGNTI
jgi:hypothetical protein